MPKAASNIPCPKIRFPVGIVSALGVVLFLHECTAHPLLAQSFRVRQLSATEVNETLPRLDAKAIPHLASPYVVDKKQSFSLESQGGARFYLEPVRYQKYDNETPPTTSYQCGAFVVAAQGPVEFLSAFKEDSTDLVQCTRLEAVGFENVAGGSVPPSIIMVYDVKSPTAVSKGISVLMWNIGARRYELNAALGLKLENDLENYTVVTIKRQMRIYALHQ